VGWGNIRANGQPTGRRGRQLVGLSGKRHSLATQGTPLHGKQGEPDKLVWAMAALAQGLGSRAVARVFAVEPHTVLGWLVEAAAPLNAFSGYCLPKVAAEPGQRDELFALLSAVQDGEVREAEAIERLARSPPWVWVAMDPVCKLSLAVDVGERTLTLAQRLLHQVTQVLAPDCAPLCLTDGLRDSLTALVTHYGQWMHLGRRQAEGPRPRLRWMPQPPLLYAPVVKSYRRRRLVRVTHPVIFGAAQPIESILAKRGGKLNTAFLERLTLDLGQHGAAIGRRVNPLGKYDAGLRQPLGPFPGYPTFVLPHASLRLALPLRDETEGAGARRCWRTRTPAMAAGLTARVWSLRDVLRYRVPPWSQN